jgi:hypothetical protein
MHPVALGYALKGVHEETSMARLGSEAAIKIFMYL